MKRKEYYDHELVYRRKLESGEKGWDSCDATAQFRKFLESEFAPKPSRALDLGCGGGEIAILLSKLGWQVTALDYSETAVEMARKNASNEGIRAEFLVSDAAKPLPAQLGRYDLIIDNHTMHCLIEKKYRRRFLANAFNLLDEKGLLFSANMTAEGYLDYEKLGIDPPTRTDRFKTRYWATKNELIEEFNEAGFRILYSSLNPGSPEEGSGDELIIYAAKNNIQKPYR